MRFFVAAEVRFRAVERELAVGSFFVNVDGAFADELRPCRIEAGSQKGAVRTSSKWLIAALTAEVKRQSDVLHKVGLAPASPPVDVLDDGSKPRVMSRVVRAEFHADVDRRNSGHRIGDAMNRLAVSHRPDDRCAVHDFRGVRQQLANIHARHRRGDRVHRPANLDGSLRFHIEGFQLTWRSVQKEQDAVLRLAETGTGCRSNVRIFRRQELRQPQSARAKSSRVQEFPAGNAVAEFSIGTRNPQHP